MTLSRPFSVQRLRPGDIALMHGLLTMFGEVFEEPETYGRARPSDAYLRHLLGREEFIALAAIKDGAVIGGLAAYELSKFEQERSEIFIYDLAVAAGHRREGVATALIEETKAIAAIRKAWAVLVQAETDNVPAIALYAKMGSREEAAHFEIPVAMAGKPNRRP